MKKLHIFFIFIALVMLAACNSNKATETQTAPVNDSNVLGHLTVTVDVANGLSTAAFTPNLSSQNLTDETSAFTKGSFTAGTIVTSVATSGKSHVAVPYTFITPAGATKEYYLIPVDNDATVGATPFSKVFDYAGAALSVASLQGLAMDNYMDGSGIHTDNSYITTVPSFGTTPSLPAGTSIIPNAAYQAKATTSGATSIPAATGATVIISSSFTGDVGNTGSGSGAVNTIPGKYNFNFLVATR